MPQEHRKTIWFGAFVLTLAIALAYSNSFWGVFLFDDNGAIIKNHSLRSFWPIGADLHSVAGPLVFSRPLINLTLKVNYHISGLQPWSYHVVNLFIHILATLTLFGIIRRTLTLPSMANRFGSAATGLAWASALIWGLHPLQTQSVTYVWQRCESQMGLFFLLTLYLSIRGWQAQNPRPWHLGAVGACLMGALSKEVMVVAPFMVLAYEIVFLERGIKKALVNSSLLYAGLIVSLFPLVYLMKAVYFNHNAEHNDFIGQYRESSHWIRTMTQTEVITHYLKLAFWPAPLVFDYAWPLADPFKIWPQLFFIGFMMIGSGVALALRRPLGYLGFWFFGILAVTSNGVLILDLAFEHRMYLSLAAPVVLVVVSAYLLWLRVLEAIKIPRAGHRLALGTGIILFTLVVVALGTTTWLRNQDYKQEITFLKKNLVHRPDNPRVLFNLGLALIMAGQEQPGIAFIRRALELKPDNLTFLYNLGVVLVRTGQFKESIATFRQALNVNPHFVIARVSLGVTFLRVGQYQEGMAQFRRALTQRPYFSQALGFLRGALDSPESQTKAFTVLHKFLARNPGSIEALCSLSMALIVQNRLPQAAIYVEKAVKIAPSNPDVRATLGLLWVQSGRPQAAFNQMIGLSGQYHQGDARVLDFLQQISASPPKHHAQTMPQNQASRPIKAHPKAGQTRDH